MTYRKIHFVAGTGQLALSAFDLLVRKHGQSSMAEADAVVALGGDGLMLSTLQKLQKRGLPVYGMNRGTVGFLMNDYSPEGLTERLNDAEHATINPLMMRATKKDGSVNEALAINEVSIIRSGPQAAKLCILIDGKKRMEELVCDGALVATPAGSTAYNYSAHGPILPIRAEVLALTPMAAFRPRRWRGAILPREAKVTFEILEPEKRPVSAAADSNEVRDAIRIDVESVDDMEYHILFDPGHGLEERLIREQFA